MFDNKNQSVRTKLGVTASVLAVAAACGLTGSAEAQTFTTTPGFNTVVVNSTFASQYKELEIANGTTGWIVPSWADATWAVGNNTAINLESPDGSANISTLSPCQNSSLAYDATSCLGGAPTIQVDKGGTLILGGQQTNGGIVGGYGFESAIHADGDVDIQYAGPPQSWGTPTQQFVGNNYFGGNVTLEQNATATFGLSWAAAQTSFGPNTNIILDDNSVMSLWLPGAYTATMGGSLQGTGTLDLDGGTLVINGANTAATPFMGTLAVSPSQTLVIGDAAHSSAVFGNPGSPSSYTLALKGTVAGSPVLKGYGTIAGNVSNSNAVVQPGGTAGSLGNLTIEGNYTQDATGTLKVEVSPTAVSGLHVMGNASLNGSLNVAIDKGSYGTNIYNIIQVDGTMTGDFSSITTTSAVQGAIAAVIKSTSGYEVVTEVVQGANSTAPIAEGNIVSANRLNNYYVVGSLYDDIATHEAQNATEVGKNMYTWIQGFGRESNIAREDVGYHTTTAGFTAGLEYRPAYHNATIGIAVTYSTENLKTKGASTADAQSWQVSAYGGTDLQYARLDGVLFYNGYNTSISRNFGSNGIAASDPAGYALGGSLQLSTSFFNDLLTPYMRGIYSRQHLDGADETGASLLDLGYNAINSNTFAGDVGFRVNPLVNVPDSKTKLLFNIALEHDFSDPGETVTGTFPIVDGQAWSSHWKGDSGNTAILGVDVGRQITDKLEISARVYGRASLYETSGEVSLGAKYRF